MKIYQAERFARGAEATIEHLAYRHDVIDRIGGLVSEIVLSYLRRRRRVRRQP